MKRFLYGLFLLIFGFLFNHNIYPQTPISSCGYTINSPGVYDITNNLTFSSGSCITINTNNVTINGNGYWIIGPGQYTSTYAIYFSSTASAGGGSIVYSYLDNDSLSDIYIYNSTYAIYFSSTASAHAYPRAYYDIADSYAYSYLCSDSFSDIYIYNSTYAIYFYSYAYVYGYGLYRFAYSYLCSDSFSDIYIYNSNYSIYTYSLAFPGGSYSGSYSYIYNNSFSNIYNYNSIYDFYFYPNSSSLYNNSFSNIYNYNSSYGFYFSSSISSSSLYTNSFSNINNLLIGYIFKLPVDFYNTSLYYISNNTINDLTVNCIHHFFYPDYIVVNQNGSINIYNTLEYILYYDNSQFTFENINIPFLILSSIYCSNVSAPMSSSSTSAPVGASIDLLSTNSQTYTPGTWTTGLIINTSFSNINNFTIYANNSPIYQSSFSTTLSSYNFTQLFTIPGIYNLTIVYCNEATCNSQSIDDITIDNNLPNISISLLNISNTSINSNIYVSEYPSGINNIVIYDNSSQVYSATVNSNTYSYTINLPYANYTNLTVCATTNAGITNCQSEIINFNGQFGYTQTQVYYGIVQLQAYISPINNNQKQYPIGNVFNFYLNNPAYYLTLNITNIGNVTLNNITINLQQIGNTPEILYNNLPIEKVNSLNIPELQPNQSYIAQFSILPFYIGSSSFVLNFNLNGRDLGDGQYNLVVNYPQNSGSIVASENMLYPAIIIAIVSALILI